MIPLSVPSAAPATPYGTVADLLTALDAMSIADRQGAALGLLNRLPVEDEMTALRRVLLAVLDLAIIDAATVDLDSDPSPAMQTMRHLCRLVEGREDAERRLAVASRHVRSADLADLLDGVARDAAAAGLPH